jgi:hypothetical protein
MAAPSTPPDTGTGEPELVIEIGEWRPAVLRALRLFLETVAVPTALLFVLLHTVGLVAALVAVISWGVLSVSVRWIAGQHMPGTLLLCVAMLCGRAGLALALSSALVYLLQPVLGSVLMALIFLGSAAFGRPITMRLARDFVSLPAQLLHRRGVKRMFTEVSLMWGGSRLVDAGMSLLFLRFGLDAGLLSRGVLSGVLSALTILTCVFWGRRSLRRLGIPLRLRRLSHP